MSEIASIHLNREDPFMLPYDRDYYLRHLAPYHVLHVAKPNKGIGAPRSVILGNMKWRGGNNWIQVVKIWGITRSDTYSYAVRLIRDVNKLKKGSTNE